MPDVINLAKTNELINKTHKISVPGVGQNVKGHKANSKIDDKALKLVIFYFLM